MSDTMHDGLAVLAFRTRAELRAWLERHHNNSAGVWVQLARANSGIESVSFSDVLAEGLCFGWSESTRHAFDDATYLQRFTPRRTPGTASARNRALEAQM